MRQSLNHIGKTIKLRWTHVAPVEHIPGRGFITSLEAAVMKQIEQDRMHTLLWGNNEVKVQEGLWKQIQSKAVYVPNPVSHQMLILDFSELSEEEKAEEERKKKCVFLTINI